ncbi:ribonuclease J [Candidatus Wolfebacteria bacterium]|nr:MAG: ribonuclease J [Candidatus Wolfebacteria bacterium]
MIQKDNRNAGPTERRVVKKTTSPSRSHSRPHAPVKKRETGTTTKKQGTKRFARKSAPTVKTSRPTTKKPPVRTAGKKKKGFRKRLNLPLQKPKGKFKISRSTRLKKQEIPKLEDGVLRIVPLGGVEEIGKNMTVIEYGDDIIIVDAGLQFSIEETPGIDFIIPNIKYLEERKEKIRGLFITHGHLDHIGAVPFIMERIGNPPIYSREFGAVMIQKRQEEYPHLAKLNMNIIEGHESMSIGKNFKISTFPISHTIPDSMGLVIGTPHGDIVFIEDVRVDNIDGVPTEEEVEQYKQFKDREILLLTMDSTSIEKPGFSLSESVVVKNIDKIIKESTGRLIIGTFASQVERIISIIELADKYGKKVVVEGRSMKSNVEIIKQLKLLKTKNLIPADDMANYPPHKIVMLATGAQGEEFAALMRISNKTHRHISLNKTDTVLLSASVIPGNEYAITKLKDNLYRQEAKIITYRDSDVHASGHGNREELGWIHKQINYKYFLPVHGHHFMLRQHAEMSQKLGTPKSNTIIPDNGSIIEIYEKGNKIRILKEKAPAELSMVDGFSVGDIQNVVIRDRQLLAQDGMFVVIANVDSKTGTLRKSPDLISRGFVYLRESQDLLHQARIITKKTIERTAKGMNPLDLDEIKGVLTDEISRFLFQKTAKRPLVIPVIIIV